MRLLHIRCVIRCIGCVYDRSSTCIFKWVIVCVCPRTSSYMARSSRVVALLLSLLGLVVFIHLSMVLFHFPLFPFQPQDIDWSQAWLWMTVLDYYGSTLCLCAICLYTEENVWTGIVWSLLFCLLGSPFCCLYCVYRLLYYHTLKLDAVDIRYRDE